MKPIQHALALIYLTVLVDICVADELSVACADALHRAVTFFQTEVAIEGTYLWEYSADLTQREGEGTASPTQGWIQPPGTPAVGLAFLRAYEVTRSPLYLEAARATGHGLRLAQMNSGGWYYHVGFSQAERRKLAYRQNGNPGARNITTLDDDTTTAALRFLMALDQTEQFSSPDVHETVTYALERLLGAQYPNGAWPQGYDTLPEVTEEPDRRASFPANWTRKWPGSGNYWYRYTLNDNVLANMIATMLQASYVYRAPHAGAASNDLARRCRAAAEKAGEFILLAQLPAPQPAWAQQYNFDMTPSWARKFEPPAVTAAESQSILRTLMLLYRHTGQPRFLAPIPKALDYLERSRLPDGRLARFYELASNQPLYFTRDYQLTYDDSQAPTHYSFKVTDQTPSIRRELNRLQSAAWRQPAEWDSSSTHSNVTHQLRNSADSVVAALDSQGRWIEPGPLRFDRPKDPGLRVIRSATFIRNVETLCNYLEAAALDSPTDVRN